MNLEPFVSVSGLGGLYKLVASRNNGLVLEDLDSGKAKFYSVRKHQFTPLGTVAIYTLEDAEPLKNVFQTMMDKLGELTIPSTKSENHVIEEYFENILPSYHEDKVTIKDMKKVIKWFNLLYDRSLLLAEENAKSEEEE